MESIFMMCFKRLSLINQWAFKWESSTYSLYVSLLYFLSSHLGLECFFLWSEMSCFSTTGLSTLGPTGRIQPTACVYKLWLEHSPPRLFAYCLWLLHSSRRVKQFQKRAAKPTILLFLESLLTSDLEQQFQKRWWLHRKNKLGNAIFTN